MWSVFYGTVSWLISFFHSKWRISKKNGDMFDLLDVNNDSVLDMVDVSLSKDNYVRLHNLTEAEVCGYCKIIHVHVKYFHNFSCPFWLCHWIFYFHFIKLLILILGSVPSSSAANSHLLGTICIQRRYKPVQNILIRSGLFHTWFTPETCLKCMQIKNFTCGTRLNMPDRKFTPISCMKNFMYEKFHTRFRPEIFHPSSHVKIE